VVVEEGTAVAKKGACVAFIRTTRPPALMQEMLLLVKVEVERGEHFTFV